MNWITDELNIVEANYTIGVDTGDGDVCAYVLARIVNKEMEILLSNSTKDKEEFSREINLLSKCFNAPII